MCALLIWFFHFIFIPFYSNLHPPLLSQSNFFVFLVFSFYLEFGCVFTSYVCLCSTVYRCSFEAAHVFLSFLHFISFSIPQLPPPFTCSLHSICYVLFLPSIPLHRIHFAFLSFILLLRLSSVVVVFFEFQSVYSTHSKRYQVVVPFFLFWFPLRSPILSFFSRSLYFIIFICYGTFNFNKWKLFSWIGRKKHGKNSKAESEWERGLGTSR